MTLTIKQVAKKMDLTISTIRYYEKEGLLPPVKRDKAGNRMFDDEDIEWLSLICCLRNTGMPVKKIKQFVAWSLDGDETLTQRIQMLEEHRASVDEQLETLTHYKCSIEWKINYHKELKKKYENGEKNEED